jgi:3-oxoacyl-[acyl-carrier protein] reductase
MTPRRVILITGANGGLGLELAREFLDEAPDNFVWLGVHRTTEAADSLAQAHAPRAECLPLNVTEPSGWSAAVGRILERHARLDVLVNNAGLHDDALLALMSHDSWDRILSVNLDAVFHGCRAVLPTMIGQRQGRIVNIASLSALLPPAGQANYAAAKAGVVALTASLAKETARLGVTVNAVCPGYIEGDYSRRLPPDDLRRIVERIPMRRLGRPSEVAAIVRFLACEQAAYLTGSAIKIDGGIL